MAGSGAPPLSVNPAAFVTLYFLTYLFYAIIGFVAYKKRQEHNLPSRSCLTQNTLLMGIALQVYHEAMITVLFEDCNTFSQDIYDQAVASLQLHRLECTCGKKGCLVFYGHYKRRLKFMSESILLTVQRVFCTECHKTHALLLSLIVPYSQIPIKDQQEILECAENGTVPDAVLNRNLLIDENNVKYIVHQYKCHWKQRLLSIGRTLKDPLAVPCLLAFRRQFMQIHRTGNILFLSPT